MLVIVQEQYCLIWVEVVHCHHPKYCWNNHPSPCQSPIAIAITAVFDSIMLCASYIKDLFCGVMNAVYKWYCLQVFIHACMQVSYSCYGKETTTSCSAITPAWNVHVAFAKNCSITAKQECRVLCIHCDCYLKWIYVSLWNAVQQTLATFISKDSE